MAAVLLTMIAGAVYFYFQQSYRNAADYPQTQLIKQATQALNEGNDPRYLIINDNVDLNKSNEPFIIIYDKSGAIVASAAILDNKHPVPPQGVFDYVAKNGQNRVTWEPKSGVRIAAVVDEYDNGYVLAGRSLTEAENKIGRLNVIVGSVWLAAIALVALISFFWRRKMA